MGTDAPVLMRSQQVGGATRGPASKLAPATRWDHPRADSTETLRFARLSGGRAGKVQETREQ